MGGVFKMAQTGRAHAAAMENALTLPHMISAPAGTVARVSPRDDRVSIGPVLPDDLALLFVWLNDADAAASDTTYRPVDCIAYKDWLDQQRQLSQQLLFVIRTLQPPRSVGFIIFKNLQPVTRSAELGLRIGVEADRGRGHGTRAARLALDYAWRGLNLHRVSLTVFADNPRAIAAYRRAGFVEEGLLRAAAFTAGRWRDVVPMAAINPAG
jgi:RimJ/RimL family protein N-acetyltransferase